MILVGTKKPKLLNPNQIVHLELSRGKRSVYVKGDIDNDGDIPTVKDISVREPWTVIVRTLTDTHYINYRNFEQALEGLISVCLQITPNLAIEALSNELRRMYGKEKETQS